MLNDLRQILTNSSANLAQDVAGILAIGVVMAVALHLPNLI
jgi:hypothetical protein